MCTTRVSDVETSMGGGLEECKDSIDELRDVECEGKPTHGHDPLTPIALRGKRPSGLTFSTYVISHQISWTPQTTGRTNVAKRHSASKPVGRFMVGRGPQTGVLGYPVSVRLFLCMGIPKEDPRLPRSFPLGPAGDIGGVIR